GAADVAVADEDLRDRLSAGDLHHPHPGIVIFGDVDLLVGDVLLLQQPLGADAVGAVLRGVDFDGLHVPEDAHRAQNARDCAPSTTTQAPAIQLARGLSRKAMASPTSSAVPKRPKGISRCTNSAIPTGSA